MSIPLFFGFFVAVYENAALGDVCQFKLTTVSISFACTPKLFKGLAKMVCSDACWQLSRGPERGEWTMLTIRFQEVVTHSQRFSRTQVLQKPQNHHLSYLSTHSLFNARPLSEATEILDTDVEADYSDEYDSPRRSIESVCIYLCDDIGCILTLATYSWRTTA